MSHISDNVILLHHVAGEGELTRAITVFKTRGTYHDPTVRSYVIADKGMTVGDQVRSK